MISKSFYFIDGVRAARFDSGSLAWQLALPEMEPVLAEIFCQKSPILVKFIAKFARFLAQNRGKFATFSPFLHNI